MLLGNPSDEPLILRTVYDMADRTLVEKSQGERGAKGSSSGRINHTMAWVAG